MDTHLGSCCWKVLKPRAWLRDHLERVDKRPRTQQPEMWEIGTSKEGREMSRIARCPGDHVRETAGSRGPGAAESPRWPARSHLAQTLPGRALQAPAALLPLGSSCSSRIERLGDYCLGGLCSCCSILACPSCLPFRIQLKWPLFQEVF